MNYRSLLLLVSLIASSSAATVDLSLKTMDATLDRIAAHAKNFPPKFANASEREQTEKELKAAIKVLDAAVAEYPNEPTLLYRDGYANAMGQHLDIPGCDQKFIDSFERFLKLKPDDKQGNFLYGGFLAGTALLRKKSIPYLEKAIELGEPDAHYTLAFVYLSQKDKEKAIHHLQEYAKAYPDEAADINARIANIKEANIRIVNKELPSSK